MAPSTPQISLVDGNDVLIYGVLAASVPSGAGNTQITAIPSRVTKVLVTTAGTGITTFYDNNVGDTSGIVIAIIPAAAVAGTAYSIDMPASNGIVAVGASGAAALTVIHSC